MDHNARRNLLERIRVYLRHHDFIYGYCPQLLVEQKTSDWWCFLWYCVRRLDTIIDSAGPEIRLTEDFAAFMRQFPDEDFQRSINIFLQETAGVVPHSLVEDLYHSAMFERDGFTVANPPSAASYLVLIDRKTVAPVRIYLLLNRVAGDRATLDRFGRGLGRAIQLLDDLLDLLEDLRRGRLFITREEMRILGIGPEEIPFNLERVAALRVKWAMAAMWPAYSAVLALPENNFTLGARGWFESVWRLIDEGKATPLQVAVIKNDLLFAHYLIGPSVLALDLLPGSELLKYHLLHRPVLTFLKRYKIFQASRAWRMYHEMEANIVPLLPFVDTFDERNGVAGQSDTRQLIELSDSFALGRLQEEMQHLVFETADEWRRDVAARFDRDPVSAFLDLAGGAADLFEAATMQSPGLRGDRIDLAASPVFGFDRIVDLGLDCFALFVQHQNAFQDEIRTWIDRRSARV